MDHLTEDALRGHLTEALEDLGPEVRDRLRGAVGSGEIDAPACCAAKVALNGEDPYRAYAHEQLARMIEERKRLRAEGEPRARLVFGGRLVEALLTRGDTVPPLWVVECAYEGWYPSIPRDRSEAILKDLLLRPLRGG